VTSAGSGSDPAPPGGADRVLWAHCFSGVAGDMFLGALLDAGADLDEVRRLLERLPLGGWALEVETVTRGGVAATKAWVRALDDRVVRTYAHIVGLIEEARLPARVRDRALAAFGALAEVEGRLHRRPPSQVHFHEVGGHDAVVDIVGTAAALEVLGVGTVTSSPVALGRGLVRSAHGLLPNPAPAVVALLQGVPTEGREVAVELTTPTGAALVATLSAGFGPQPAMVAEAVGYGAGTREIDGLVNCLQVVLGRRTPSATEGRGGQPLVTIETNVDDATGEVLARALQAALEVGAYDAWLTPVVMKKGRPGYVFSALADPSLLEAVRDVVRRETGSLGVRATTGERWPASRREDLVEVDGYPIRVKVSPGRTKAEHDDALRVARQTGRPLRVVLDRAEEAWRRAHPDADSPGGPPSPA
jgi:uncharacterized protein (TIGR00299 family) protein